MADVNWLGREPESQQLSISILAIPRGGIPKKLAADPWIGRVRLDFSPAREVFERGPKRAARLKGVRAALRALPFVDLTLSGTCETEEDSYDGVPIGAPDQLTHYYDHTADALALFDGEPCPTLRKVSIDYADPGAAQIATMPFFENVRDLSIYASRLTGREASQLFTSDHLQKLERLVLAGNRISSDFRDVKLPRLHALSLAENSYGSDVEFGASDVSRLIATPWNLERLDLSSNRIKDAGAVALAGWERASTLTFLDVSNNWIDAEGMKALLQSPHFGSVVDLRLAGNRVGDEGAQLLAARDWSLTSLDLAGCQITDEGALVLANAPWVERLEELDMTSNSITDKAKKKLGDRLGAKLIFNPTRVHRIGEIDV